MKIKCLRHSKNNAFVHIIDGYICTGDLPQPLSDSATIELIKLYHKEYYPDLDWDDIELVEYDLINADEVGADIRNKLSPPLNLISLINLYLKENDEEIRINLKKYIEREVERSEKNIKYISNLL